MANFTWAAGRWILLVGGLGAWLTTLVMWLSSTQVWPLRRQLMTLSPIFLWAAFFLILLAFILSAKSLRQIFLTFGRNHWLSVLAVVVLAFALVHFAAPRTHRLYYDEDIYQAIGLHIAHNNQAAMVHDGRWEDGHFRSLRSEYNKQPNGWPFLISLAYRVMGVSETSVFNLSNALFVLACLLVFICGCLLFRDAIDGVFAALVYALIPENALWFSTMSVEPAAATFSLLAMASTLLFFRERSNLFFFLSACAWALAVQFRPETLLLLGVVVVIFYIDGWEEMKSFRFYGFGLLFLVLATAHFAHLYAVKNESWGSSGTKLATSFILENLKTNTIYYWDNQRFPLFVSLLACAGLLWPGDRRPRLYVGLWFLTAWGIFLTFYAGSYRFGADVRFSILSMAPLALVAGRGAGRVTAFMQARWANVPSRSVMVLILGANLLFFLPFIRATSQEAWECRDDHDAAEVFAGLLPPDGIIFTHNPNMFQIWGKNAAQASIFTEDPNYVQQSLQPQMVGKMYVHWNYWCNVNVPTQRRFVENILNRFETTVVQEKFVRGRKFALYQIGRERGRSQ